VLLAMGIPRELALCSLRVSFDQRVDQGELSRFAHALADVVARRRGY
jgi:cysteine desulfurase